MQIAEEFLTEGDSDQWDEVWHRTNLTTLAETVWTCSAEWNNAVCALVCVCVCLPVIFKQHKSISCSQEVAYQHLHRSWNALWSSYPLQKKRRLQHKLQGDRERLNKADGWKQTSSCSSPPTRSQTIAISTPLCSGLPSASQRGVWSERGGNCCEFVGNWKLLYPPVSPSLPALKTSTPLLPPWPPPSIPIHS